MSVVSYKIHSPLVVTNVVVGHDLWHWMPIFFCSSLELSVTSQCERAVGVSRWVGPQRMCRVDGEGIAHNIIQGEGGEQGHSATHGCPHFYATCSGFF